MIPALPPFQAFMNAHRADVYAFLRATAGPQDVDDCFQETFLSALRAYPRLHNGTNLRAWVLTIATRKAIDAARSRARRARPVEDAGALADERTVAAHQDAPNGDLWLAVASLPPRQRAAVVHRHVLGLPYKEVAVALGCSEEAARANVYQAIRTLRKRWKDAGE